MSVASPCLGGSKPLPQHPLLSLAENGIQGEDFGHASELLSFPESLLHIRVIKLLFDILLLICL